MISDRVLYTPLSPREPLTRKPALTALRTLGLATLILHPITKTSEQLAGRRPSTLRRRYFLSYAKRKFKEFTATAEGWAG